MLLCFILVVCWKEEEIENEEINRREVRKSFRSFLREKKSLGYLENLKGFLKQKKS